MSDTFGMMDTAYFTSKSVILEWLNSTLKLNVTKIEQAGTGAIYCQLLDILHPGKVKLSKVNWRATSELEFLSNFKVLQQAMYDLKIGKKIDIARLSKAKYQDNFELLQWFKGYFDNKNPDLTHYDPEKRRNYATLEYLSNTGAQVKSRKVYVQRAKSKEKQLTNGLTNEKLTTIIEKVNINPVSKTEGNYVRGNNILPSCGSSIQMNSSFNSENLVNVVSESFAIEIDKKYEEDMNILIEENNKNKREINTLKMLLAEVGKEKEFYYSKLRDFEFLLNKETSTDKEGLIEIMKNVLYSTKETEVVIDQYGNPVINH